ncbi:MAG: diguanylate cyclase [Desulfobacteraceae bacterium]|jgi:diguanylate cyclase (GGDEF)-like protein
MEHRQELFNFLEHSGKDPSRLIFEDELTGIYNRRFLYQYLQSKVQWDTLEKRPFSLLMMDVDNFKQINDRYGHQIGDQALIWVAGLIQEVAGEDGLAVRYAGDEFMLLLPTDKRTSLLRGEKLYKRVHEQSFQPSTADSPLQITLSIGIASAPEDAKNSKALIQRADTALYSAKKKGRDCYVNATEVALEDVFDKTAIYQLEDVKLVGRSKQLAQVTNALKIFSKKKSQFLIVEGSPGLGKTEFLEAIRQNLSRKKIWQVKVNGASQEMFRPYYLITKILIDILNKRKDKGEKVLENLNPKELSYLGQIIPQLGDADEAQIDGKEGQFREGIFTTLVHFIPKIVGKRPLIIFIDDLHFGDEATMLLLRKLIMRDDLPLFICGTSSETKEAKVGEKGPLERFHAAYGQELGLQKISLTPLTAAQIARHIKRIFPSLDKPDNFEDDLFQITQGNPLFVSEILRKLVMDQQISLVGQRWVIRPVEEGYLPKSLEEIVTQKIAALDEDSRQMLEQVSALGDDVSLSMLIGSSEAMEAKVLEFIDQAVAQGLLQSDFQLNDEVIRFLGKRVLEIAYGSIDQDRKQELHERIGNYQETLYQRQFLPSAATLAYHFKRSTDQEKAGTYERILATSNASKFNAQEAVLYTAEEPAEIAGADVPLDADGLARVPHMIREFMIAVRNIKLYPPGSRPVIDVTQKVKTRIDGILEKNEHVNIMQIERALVVNGQKIATKDFKVVAKGFLELLNQLQLKGIAFLKGLTEGEVEVMLEAFGRTEQKTFDERHWERLMIENNLEHIDLKQIRYTRRGKAEDLARDQLARQRVSDEAADEMHRKETRLVAEILRGLLSAGRTIKLYPLESNAITSVLQKTTKYVRSYIKNRGVLTLSRAEDVLLVNGEKFVSSQFKVFGDTFYKYLGTIGLSSLTFMKRFTEQELKAFIGALGDLPRGVDGKFWKRLAKEKGVAGILFDRHLYEVQVAEAVGPSATGEFRILTTMAAAEHQPDEEMEMVEEVPFSSLLDNFQDQIKELLLNKEEAEIKEAILKLFRNLPAQVIADRQRAIQLCLGLLESLTPAFQHDFARLLAAPLLSALSKEDDPDVMAEMAALFDIMLTILIQFVEYRTAGRVLSHLRKRQRELEEVKDSNAQLLAKRLKRKLDPSTEKLLLEDLKSGDSTRLRNAAQLLAGFGQGAVPFLIEIIKQEDDYRARKISAMLLKKHGPEVVERLKELLVLEVTPEERSRILDVIDTLTSDLRKEVEYALGDEDSQVRQAAFRLVERLNNNQIVALLLDLASTQTGNLAVSAIKCLGKLKPPKVDETLIDLLDSSKEDELCIVCCRALGQIASPAAIDSLTRLLVPQGFFPFRKNRNPDVRAAAAYALGRISHPDVHGILAHFVDDIDPRVQEIARSIVRPDESAQD